MHLINRVIHLVIAKFDVIKGSLSRELFLPESSMTALSIDRTFIAALKYPISLID